ncbi:MAG: PilZ domain-containing protein [Tepidisphaerales bacterium]
MQLYAELWASLIRSIRWEQRRSLPEKRKNPRVQIRARITITPLEGGQPAGSALGVWTRDVSSQGLSFTSGQHFRVQQQFMIELPGQRGAPLRLLASTRQCRKLADRVYSIGLVCESLEMSQPQAA